MFIVYHNTKFHTPSSKGSLVIVIKRRVK